MKKNNLNSNDDQKNTKNKIDWTKTNNLTKTANEVNFKKKLTYTSILFFIILTIISSFIFSTIYSVQKAYNYNKYNSVTLNIKFPKITKEDFLGKYIYDSDESTIVNITEDIFNDQIPEIIKLNPWIKFFISISNYNINDMTLKMFTDINYMYPIQPSDLLYYNPNKVFYIQFYYEDKPIDWKIHNIKLNVGEQSFYFMLFSLFKNFQSPINSTSNLDFTNYFPKIYYSPYIENSTNIIKPSENKWLYIKIHQEVNIFLNNEEQETENIDSSKNSTFKKLQVKPYITTNEIPYISSYSAQDLTNLQLWFKNSNNKYLNSDNYQTEALNLVNDSNIYITLLPKAFDVESFIKSSDPLSYYENLKLKYSSNSMLVSDSLLPIYQGYWVNNPNSNNFIQSPHLYYNDWTATNSIAQSTYLESSLTTFYRKNQSINIFNLDGSETIEQIKNDMLNNIYNYLCLSLEKSYKWTPLIDDSKIILQELFGIYSTNDLIPYLKFIDIYHNYNKDPDKMLLLDFCKINMDDLKKTKSILFQLPWLNKINNASDNWNGGFLFKEKQLENIER